MRNILLGVLVGFVIGLLIGKDKIVDIPTEAKKMFDRGHMSPEAKKEVK